MKNFLGYFPYFTLHFLFLVFNFIFTTSWWSRKPAKIIVANLDPAIFEAGEFSCSCVLVVLKQPIIVLNNKCSISFNRIEDMQQRKQTGGWWLWLSTLLTLSSTLPVGNYLAGRMYMPSLDAVNLLKKSHHPSILNLAVFKNDILIWNNFFILQVQ